MSARRFIVVTMLCWATAGVAAAQTYTETTTRVISGEVVRLEPGKTIVVRSGGEEVTYVLAPGVALPEGVEIGRSVTLKVEPGADGATLVKQVTTTTLGPDGQVKKTTEITRTDATGQTSRSAISARAGRVEAYMPGKSITVIDAKGQRLTYVLAGESQVPSEIVMGKEVTVYAAPTALESATTYEIEQDGDTIKIKAKKAKPE
jgi:hypothetical protein